jgi:hypothetical protein
MGKEIIAYHGSLIGNIDEFFPWSHFGTENAALAAAAAKYLNPRHNNARNVAYIYQVCINIKESEIIDGSDFGGTASRLLLSYLQEVLKNPHPEQSNKARDKALEIFRATPNKQYGQDVAARAVKEILDEISKKAIRYRNVAEDKNSVSYALMDCRNTVSKQNSRILDTSELTQGFYSLTYQRIVAGLIHPLSLGDPEPFVCTVHNYPTEQHEFLLQRHQSTQISSSQDSLPV